MRIRFIVAMSEVFRFAEFAVGEREFRLTRLGQELGLEPKALRVLLYLVRNPGRLVTKGEMLDAVWGDVSVLENSLTRAMSLLRRALNDDVRKPRIIATVQRAGYRFICPVAVSNDASSLVVVSEKATATASRDPVGTRPNSSAIRKWLFLAVAAFAFVIALAVWNLTQPLALLASRNTQKLPTMVRWVEFSEPWGSESKEVGSASRI